MALGVVSSLLDASALAAGGGDEGSGDGSAANADPQYTQAVAAIKAQQYAKATSYKAKHAAVGLAK